MARAKVKPIVDVELPADDDLREVDGPTAVTGVGIDVQFKGDKEPWRLRTLELENDEHLDQLQELLDDARQRNAVKDVAAKAFAAIGEAFQAIDAEKVRIAGDDIAIAIDYSGESDEELLENLAALLDELESRGMSDLNKYPQYTDGDYLIKSKSDRCAPDDGDPCCGATEADRIPASHMVWIQTVTTTQYNGNGTVVGKTIAETRNEQVAL